MWGNIIRIPIMPKFTTAFIAEGGNITSDIEQVDFTFHYLPDKGYWVDPNNIPLMLDNGGLITGGSSEVFDAWDKEKLLLPMENGGYYNPKFKYASSFKEQAYLAFRKREPDNKKPQSLLKGIISFQDKLHDRIHNRETEEASGIGTRAICFR